MRYQVMIRGEYAADDGFELDLGLVRRQAWQQVPLPKCPDCGGALEYRAESPTTASLMCVGIGPLDDPEAVCGSLFLLWLDGGRHLRLRRKKFGSKLNISRKWFDANTMGKDNE